jgi:ABC-type uncharacterized transport system involved in gliding motility auxiliary subunit
MIFQKIKTAFAEMDWRKLAPWSLALGIIGLIFAGIAYYSALSFTEWVYVPLGIGVILILLAIFFDPEQFQSAFTGRKATNSWNVFFMTFFLAVILVIVNFFVNAEGAKHNWWVDLTENKSLTLASETIQTLHTIKDPIAARAYFVGTQSSANGFDAARKLLEQYKTQSNGTFTYTIVDPVENPVLAAQDNITQDGTVVLAVGTRQEKVTSVSESELTSAIIRINFPGERQVYFLTGHQEGSIKDPGATAYTEVVKLLAKKNYTVAALDLVKEGKVPDNAKAVVIAGPHAPLLDSELAALQAYWKKGGGIILLQSPSSITQMDSSKDILAAWLAKDFNIVFQNDLIIDLRITPNTAAASIPSDLDSANPITKSIQTLVIFPSAQSIAWTKPADSNLSFARLAEVGQDVRTWGETDQASMLANASPSFDAATDHKSPLIVAMSVNDFTTDAHLTVIGTADLGSDKYVLGYGNSDFVVNAVDWSAGMSAMVNLTPKDQTPRTILPPYPWVITMASLTSACGIPLLFIIIGIAVLINRRRHK